MNSSVFAFPSLTYFTKKNTLQFHPCCCKWQISLFHSWVIFDCVFIYHIFFIHLAIVGELCGFQILAIVNNTTMNIGVHIYFWINVFVFFRCIPRTGIAGSYGNSIFSFYEEASYCFPQWLHQFTFPPTDIKETATVMLNGKGKVTRTSPSPGAQGSLPWGFDI